MEVGSTLLSSPTVGRGRCPSVVSECLHAGFAFITVGDCPDANHKYMTGVTWHEAFFVSVLAKGKGTLLFYGEILFWLSLCPFSPSLDPCYQR